jgi:hypothetical protein
MTETTVTIDTTTLAAVLKSQCHASLAMLRDAIEKCPDDLWLDARPRNAFWQVAYHVLFFTHLSCGTVLDPLCGPPYVLPHGCPRRG